MPLRVTQSGWTTRARVLVAVAMGAALGVTILPATAGAASAPGVTSNSITGWLGFGFQIHKATVTVRTRAAAQGR